MLSEGELSVEVKVLTGVEESFDLKHRKELKCQLKCL